MKQHTRIVRNLYRKCIFNPEQNKNNPFIEDAVAESNIHLFQTGSKDKLRESQFKI